ncbi:PAAR domain-containing protein [Burkholderia multivorans]|uniref:PAAR domain-containing protein n=1 Tax=Burkholderia multivorans TaxID=87883 RepID=UPI000D0070DB|nr:PAAR domain-containing protein [Burkholderia multivorans]MBJ9942138.1 PAAR domain-containing protein [Burkholderia multivorans]MBU9284343.1 PAAR domain-containing protein [Burkholderia multivorans]MBU9613015.1 PAAR domain-containing protein [Burkholderia multivorans]MCA8386852.1 PAAR domain-containing protein [Burkholderia multivorans]PRE19933.1 PAAR domain-containing protein [Burkholderia multivorans]
MRRYDIVKGDTTTVGGIVQGGDGSDVIGEREQAYEHDPVWCPVCKTVGKIGCSGQRISTTGPDGREAALSDDLCLCACPTPPKLVASQSVSYVDV